jgi:hypothetical protein
MLKKRKEANFHADLISMEKISRETTTGRVAAFRSLRILAAAMRAQ